MVFFDNIFMSIYEKKYSSEKVPENYEIASDQQLKQIIFWYMFSGTLWLIFGSILGLFNSLKFNFPDLGTVSWLSFGRLRPIHTNTLFWGWCSLAMLALAHYIVPRVGLTRLFSNKLAWLSLLLINFSVISGDGFLFAGVNNGDHEYREYIWPVMSFFGLGIIITGYNFYMTVATRKTKEIYIANWYIISAVFWTAILEILSYIPAYQYGLSETVVQGYYMHQAVGMWFTPMMLGTTYYFIPKLTNKPIYSYNLSVLAFWTQLTFYTMIGSHHFLYGPIPWWLQNIAIVFSIGMAVPVIAGTADFYITLWGCGRQIRKSVPLLFLFFGVAYYFAGSMEGSLQAIRSLNIKWHFTDYIISHSHTTMYGFVTFLIWGGAYALLPEISGRQAPKFSAWANFILAFTGLLLFEISLLIGGHKQGNMWLAGKPFIDTVVMLKTYWAWRTVGGTMMFTAHLFFIYSVWKMRPARLSVGEVAIQDGA
jgi:cytochrome c oxidase cbb3-type subunit 1